MDGMFLKFSFTLFAFLLFIQANAINYYIAANGNDSYTVAQAHNKATPWQSITKLNANFAGILPGDSILFRCGDTFLGSILITKSGTATNPIIIASYGTGNKPIISGLAPTSNWINLGGGIFQADCPKAAAVVNVVVSNGIAQPLGRYPNLSDPNSGYLNIDSHVAGTQITSSALNTAVNWAGAEVVIRENHWTINRGIIGSNTATVINYSGIPSNQPLNNFGFFIQNHPSTLDQPGEWYYNPATKKLNMFFGASMPNGANVQVSSYDSLVYMKNNNYVVINGLAFLGANNYAIQLQNANYVTISNSSLTLSGITALYAPYSHNLVIKNDTIAGSNNAAIYLLGAHNTISNNIVYNNGVIPGMGAKPSPSYSAIIVNGLGNLINNNDVENCGYDGIMYSGDSVIVKNNFVSNFTEITDDGGGIYGWSGPDTTVLNYGRQVVGNIIVNGISATNGTSGTFIGCSVGIYADDNSSGISITGNTVSACSAGAKLHNSQTIVFSGNTLYNNAAQLIVAHDNPIYTSKNLSITGNIAFSKYPTQQTLDVYSIKSDIPGFGTFNNNYYSNIIDNTFQLDIANTELNLKMWQSFYQKDLASSLAIPIPYYTISSIDKRNEFPNGSFNTNITGAATSSANGNFKSTWANKLDGGSFEGYFSFVSGSPTNGQAVFIHVGPVTASNTYMFKFSMIATKSNERVVACLINASPPYNTISENQYASLDTVRSENTFYFNPTQALPNTILVLSIQHEDATIWLDNVGFYPINATLNNPDNNLFFAYNNTTSPKIVKFGKAYVDVKNNPYSNSTTLAPFTSILLIKKSDSLALLPPVIYTAPNISKDIADASNTSRPVTVGVYPNPASEYLIFNFNGNDVQDLNINLMNSNGQTVMSQKVQVNANSYKFQFNSKPRPGSYFLHISGSGLDQMSKVIIL